MSRKFGLIGFPLGHSFSEVFFTEKFTREGIDASYSLYPLGNINQLNQLMIATPELSGFNVTIPYKEKVIAFLDEVSKEAKEIGAVNVVKITEKKGKKILSGYNTDYIGFSESLSPLLPPGILNALVLGTGGASKAIAFALKKLGIKPILVSRRPEEGEIGYEDLMDDIIAKNLLIVNTTPLGMFPNIESCPPIPYHLLTEQHICYDLVYNPEMTKFMIKSKKQGATVKNGLEMLHRQAEEAWKIWK
ncbi:MAG: shikimate dehydrogenase, partial [Muribaculaceae bacterium]|nr:shikimate dehydrogenase [Muribaculaceae bacterium]MDE6027534.1 shikimate dehydrogenase [Muribaculaceae bacterium]